MTSTLEKETQVIRRQTRRFLAIIAIALVGGLVIMVAFIFLTNTQVKKYQTLVQGYQVLLESRVATQNLQNLAASKIAGLTVIADVFPDESTIIDVIQQLETLVQQFDPHGTVRFTPQGPFSVNNQKAVNLVFHFDTAPVETIAFMRRLERLTHMVEINNVDIKTPGGASASAQITLGVTLYVQDPFNQSN